MEIHQMKQQQWESHLKITTVGRGCSCRWDIQELLKSYRTQILTRAYFLTKICWVVVVSYGFLWLRVVL